MSSLITVRKAIRDHLRTTLPRINFVTYLGRISLEEVRNIGLRGPSGIVTCLGAPRFQVQGTVVIANAVFAVFCVSQRTPTLDLDEAAMAVAQDVAVEVPHQTWNSTANRAPNDLVATNLHTTQLISEGLGLWVVRWRQDVELTRNVTATLEDFDTFHGTYDMDAMGGDDDTPTTEDQVDLT